MKITIEVSAQPDRYDLRQFINTLAGIDEAVPREQEIELEIVLTGEVIDTPPHARVADDDDLPF